MTNRTAIGNGLGLTSKDLKQIELTALTTFLKAAEHLYELYAIADNNYQELKQARQKLKEEQLNRAAVESLQAIVATFSPYLNNATAAISGRTQLLELALRDGDIHDKNETIARALEVFERSCEQIVSVIHKLKNINVFKTSIYHDSTKIIDLDKSEARREAELTPDQV